LDRDLRAIDPRGVGEKKTLEDPDVLTLRGALDPFVEIQDRLLEHPGVVGDLERRVVQLPRGQLDLALVEVGLGQLHVDHVVEAARLRGQRARRGEAQVDVVRKRSDRRAPLLDRLVELPVLDEGLDLLGGGGRRRGGRSAEDRREPEDR